MHTLTIGGMLILGHSIPLGLAIPTAPRSENPLNVVVPSVPSVPRAELHSSIASDPPTPSQNWKLTSLNVHFMGPTNNWVPGAREFNTTLEFNLDLGDGFKVTCRANWTQGHVPVAPGIEQSYMCENARNDKPGFASFTLRKFDGWCGDENAVVGEATWGLKISRRLEAIRYVCC
jgi:hypothetical protein